MRYLCSACAGGVRWVDCGWYGLVYTRVYYVYIITNNQQSLSARTCAHYLLAQTEPCTEACAEVTHIRHAYGIYIHILN